MDEAIHVFDDVSPRVWSGMAVTEFDDYIQRCRARQKELVALYAATPSKLQDT